jgi:hypothetical protein
MKSKKTGNELERLTETYIVSSPSSYHRLTENEINKYNIPQTEKLSESLNESLLNEVQDEQLRKLISNLKEKNAQSGIAVWKVPISKFTKNGNGRIYGKKLWENVINNQRNNWQGLYGLCDHPKDDNDPGSMKNVASVWHDMFIEGDTVYGICSLIGEYGRLINDILSCGGRAGTSTSGFGEVNKITKEVDPDTFICERASDWVINPSQGTYATIDCPHTPSEFLDNIHGGATIEFGKQKTGIPVRENINIRSKIMAEKLKFDAAAPIKESAPAQSNDGAQSEVKEVKKPGLSKMEEKAFRKYVDIFMKNAEGIDNPIARLNECMDILDCFEEGNCPDLKESLEKKLLEEKTKLEALVEKVTSTEKDFGMDIDSFRKAAERNTTQGLLLKEQVTDYKSLCEGLTKRNKVLVEKIDELSEKLKISEKLTEKKILNANKEIVSTSSEADKLKEELKKASDEIINLKNSIKKLSEGNKQFEKENGLLNTKLKEAVEIIKTSKEKRLQESEVNKNAFEQVKLLEAKVTDLEKTNKELENVYTVQSQRYDKLQESFDTYKKEVADTYNPVAHLLPNSTERVGKYLNLRENKAIEIENYWADLKEQYGEAIDPFEDQIRGAKTLREATYQFMKYRTQIDGDFAVAQPAEFNYHSRAERARIYENQGIINPVNEYKTASIEQKNAEFLQSLKSQGLV